MGVKGDLLALIESFLLERQQRIFLNGRKSEWLTINVGVPQGSVHCFFINIDNLSDNL